MRHPHVLQLIMDSLRYWVTEMHVDGFRFDLAATLARQFHEVDRLSAFFDLVQQDPVVSQVKLIAEPWDVGDGGYQVGNFPPLWTEWNGKYRDTVRDFWRGEPATLGRVRAPGSPARPTCTSTPAGPDRVDQLRHRPRRLHAARPRLLQREAQRGQRRGQQGRREPQPVLELRRRGPDRRPRRLRAARPAAAQLPDHPAALAGRPDARARRRAGPHPAGQQQRLLPGQRALLGGLGPRRRRTAGPAEFTRRLVAAAPRAPGVPPPPLLRRHGRPRRRRRPGDIAWFTPDGEHMDDADWGDGDAKPVVVFLNGDAISEPDRARRADRRRLVPARCSTPTTSRSTSCCRRGVRRGVGRGARHRDGDGAASRAKSIAVDPRAASARRGGVRASPDAECSVAARSIVVLSAAQAGRSDRARRVTVRPARRPTGCSSTPEFGFDDAARRAAATWRPRASRTSTCRRSCRPRPARRTGTTSSTTTGCRAELGGACGFDAAGWPRCARRGLGSSSTSCPTTWPCRRRRGTTRRCGRCCGTGRPRRTRSGSTWTGTRADGRVLDAGARRAASGRPGRRRARSGPTAVPGGRDRAALLRPRVPGPAGHRGRCRSPSWWSGSTTGWRTGGWPTRS